MRKVLAHYRMGYLVSSVGFVIVCVSILLGVIAYNLLNHLPIGLSSIGLLLAAFGFGWRALATAAAEVHSAVFDHRVGLYIAEDKLVLVHPSLRSIALSDILSVEDLGSGRSRTANISGGKGRLAQISSDWFEEDVSVIAAQVMAAVDATKSPGYR